MTRQGADDATAAATAAATDEATAAAGAAAIDDATAAGTACENGKDDDDEFIEFKKLDVEIAFFRVESHSKEFLSTLWAESLSKSVSGSIARTVR